MTLNASRAKTRLYRSATGAAIVGLVANLLLGLVKVSAGLVANSFALISDAVNSLGDALTSVVVLLALRVAQRPPDAEHPYGHTRAEAIAASSVALLVIVSALLVAWEALHRISVTHPVPPAWTLWLAGANAVIKEGLYRYKIAVSKRTGSSALKAVAWDHRSDALCALAVLIGLAVVRLGGPDWIFADELAALVVVGIVLFAASKLYRDCVIELLDAQADPELVQAIRTMASAVPGVAAIEKLRVRKSGLEFLVDIHVQVDPELPVRDAHDIGHCVKDELLARFPELLDVLVHLEPFPGCRVET
jgi:cation diffusion facilitator family transporter